MFFSGSPYSIDTDDGSDRVNCTSNVIVAQPLFKTDFSGHTKTFQRNVALWGACGGSQAGAGDHTNVFSGNKCVGAGSPLQTKNGTCAACAEPGVECPVIADNMYYAANATAKAICPAGNLEVGSQELPLPADGGIALAKAALGM